MIGFGSLIFTVKLKVKTDRRGLPDNSHIHMMTDWKDFLKHAGLTPETQLRFELHTDKCVAGKTTYFEAC
jgi:hypothetical protein